MQTRQAVPSGKGEMARCILESLAVTYRKTIEGLEDIRGRKIGTIHIVGGGSQNELLNQMTADACGRPVITGPIEVGLDTEADLCCVTVRDPGPGLTTEQQEHLFEAFFTTKPQGLGLGLSICKTIVESHGGQLQAQAASLGAGMEFRFFLPCHSHPASQPATE